MSKSAAMKALDRAVLAIARARSAATSATARAYCDGALEEMQRAVGTGRKGGIVTRIALQVRLPSATIDRLDAARGDVSRAAYIAALIDGGEPTLTRAPRTRMPHAAPPTGARRKPRLTPEDTAAALDSLRREGETWGAFATRVGVPRQQVSQWLRQGMTEDAARKLGLAPVEEG